jgi:hypothetical protein
MSNVRHQSAQVLIPALLSALILNPESSFAAALESRAWLGLFGRKTLSDTRSFWHEAQFRYDLGRSGMQQLLARAGILQAVGGPHEFGWILGYIQSGTTQEFRPTLQYSATVALEDTHFFGLRVRGEWRRLNIHPDNSLRFRTLVSYRLTVSPRTSFLVWDEPFLNLTREEWSGNRLFERNRLFLGIRLDGMKDRIEFGYLNQMIPRFSSSVSEHTLVLYYFY